MASTFPRSTSGGISPERKPRSSSPQKPKGSAINIIEPKAKKSGSMSIKVHVEKIVMGNPKADAVNRPGNSRYRQQPKS